MRPSHTVTISLPPDLAAEVDRLAAAEHRTRSELMREAFRRYLASQGRWERVFELGDQVAAVQGLDSESAVDVAVDHAVAQVRRRRQAGR